MKILCTRKLLYFYLILNVKFNYVLDGNKVFMKAPSGNGKLTEAEFADVTAFIVDQATGDKW